MPYPAWYTVLSMFDLGPKSPADQSVWELNMFFGRTKCFPPFICKSKYLFQLTSGSSPTGCVVREVLPKGLRLTRRW